MGNDEQPEEESLSPSSEAEMKPADEAA